MRTWMFILLLVFCFHIDFSIADTASEKLNMKKKKIVFVKDDDGEAFNYIELRIREILAQKGWSKENSEFIVYSLKGKQNTKSEIILKLKELKPDVVLINSPHIKDLALKLNDENIKFISGGGLELVDENNNKILIDDKGFPIKNVAGTYTLPLNHLENSFKRMKEIAPLDGKKAVFVTSPQPAFTKEKVEAALKLHNIELKEYAEYEYIEEYKEFLFKYKNDPEVGWFITGEHVARSLYENSFSVEEFCECEREIINKANFGFWPIEVQNGKLGALAVDTFTTIFQMVAMADSLLRGVELKDLQTEEPLGTVSMLNKERADEIGLEINIDILESTDIIYTDYNGNFVSNEVLFQ